MLRLLTSQRIGTHSRKYTVIPGRALALCSRASLSGMAEGHIWGYALEEAGRKESPHGLVMERLSRKKRMVNIYFYIVHILYCRLSQALLSTRIQYLFKPKPGTVHPGHTFYRSLFPKIIQDIDSIENNWRMGRHNLQVNDRISNIFNRIVIILIYIIFNFRG